MRQSLTPVIRVDEEKCVNCYACINACPVKYCMDGSGEKLSINPDLCIGCGNCIAACRHEARQIIDDTPRFFEDLRRGEKMIAIAAPAVASVFPGKYRNLNGYLKSLGVHAVFDVSFGAELTVFSYLNYIKEKKPRTVIAQPCPAIVTFIEIYHPELLPYLAPADSPMLHTIKMISEYYPQYRSYKTAVISPCIAKRREFDETGLGNYNVTMLALKNYLEEHGVELGSFPPLEYMGAPAERAVQFSSPGGLLDTVERFVPGIRRSTRKIEGPGTIYPYLAEVAALMGKPDIQFPLLVDCLNCEKGCNGGPGTGNCHKPIDELESPVRKRSAELEKQHNPKQLRRLYEKYHKSLAKSWRSGLYNRDYRSLSGNNTLTHPTEAQLQEVYRSMKKFSPDDLYDCTACGYGSCEAMATAIFNKLNKPANCAHYNKFLLEEEKTLIEEMHEQLKKHVDLALKLIENINAKVDELKDKVSRESSAVEESSRITEKMIGSLKETAESSQSKKQSIKELIDNAAKGRDSMNETIRSVRDISQSVDGIASAIKIISGIAANTNLLAMNAAIESAHAGEAGLGFAVVAGEIRRLSETTRENSRSISQTLSDIIQGIADVSRRAADTDSLMGSISDEVNSFASIMTDLVFTLNGLSQDGSVITDSLATLREIAASINTSYTEMIGMTDKLRKDMNELVMVSESEAAG